ncbi:hypothetical protein ACNQGL_09770 [Flavobacterium sp. LB3P21]|uniref:hypothetical protein n=1 Tax=Flavobacterium sp. LB3P21 TaxID=3401719 RepID=UPI003AAC22C1
MINENKVSQLLSPKRFNSYLKRCENNADNALNYYVANSKIAEATYWSLQAFEVALRNKIHSALTQHFGTVEWYNTWLASEDFTDFHSKIIETKNILKLRNEPINSNKMIAEFMLGFWIKMFNAKYENLLWKPLRTIFANMPKQERQRNNVAGILNKVRNFRNRVYHYEPICWDFNATNNNYNNITKAIQWFDADYLEWTIQFCDFNKNIKYHTTKLNELGVKKVSKL